MAASTATSKNRPPDRSRTTVKIDRQDEQEPNPSRSSQEPLGLGDQQQNNHHHHRDRGSRINVKPEVGSLLFPKKEPEIFDLGNDSDSELEVVYEKKGSSNTAAASTAVSRKNEQRDVIDVLDSDSDSESSVNKRKLSSSSRRKNNNKFKSSERFGGGLPNGTASTLSSSSSSSSGSSSVIQIESDMEEESNKSGAEDVLMADPADSFNSFGGGNVWEGSYFQDLNNVMPTDDDGGVATSSAPVEVITPKTETPSLNGFETEPEELPDLIDAEEMPIEEVAAERKRLGNEYFTKGEYHRALEMYSNAIDLVPTDPTYFGNRSACLLMMQKFKDAAKDARQALSLDPNFKNGFIRLVRSNIALGDITATELAIASAEAKAELKIDLKDERQKLATLKLLRKEIEQSDEKKDFRKTLYLTERAKSIAVGDVSLKIKRAETLIKLGRYVDAQEQCTEILQSDGMIVEAITLRAYCFYQADSLDKALQYYKQALTLAPDNRTAAVNYKKMKQVKELREAGADSFRNRCWNEANSAYKQCLDLIEADGDGNVVLGSKINFNLALVAGKSDSDLSLSFVNKALSLNPQYVKALLHRAGIYMDVEKFDEAIRDFEAVEKLDPGTSNIRRLIENAKLMAKKAKRKDYYKILGIDKKASTDEIKKAYKKRALDHHPDRHANATETERRDQERKFKEVLEAYEILLDDKKRRRYDMGLDINESASSNYEPFDASAMFGHMFFQHAGMGGMGGRPGGFHQFRAGPGYSGFRR